MRMEENQHGGFPDLSRDIQDVVTSWLTSKKAIPESWMGVTDPITPKTSIELQNLGKYGCRSLVNQARKSKARLAALAAAFTELAEAMEAHSATASDNYEPVCNMSSLIILPAELISRIFDFVVKRSEPPALSIQQNAALLLSRVSSHFRTTAISCPELWANIGWQNSKLTALFLKRAKNAPLCVELTAEIQRGRIYFKTLLLDLLPRMRFCSSLVIKLLFPYMNARETPVCLREPGLLRSFRELDMPLLEALEVNACHSKSTQELGAAMKRWNTPRLWKLRTRYFPLSKMIKSQLSYSITDFEVTFDSRMSLFNDLLDFLSTMKSLERLNLNYRVDYPGVLHDLDDDLVDDLWQDDEPVNANEVWTTRSMELPSVRYLTANIFVEHRGEDPMPVSNLYAIYKFFSSVIFPGAVYLNVILRVNVEKCDSTLDFTHLLSQVFLSTRQFPCVEHARFEVRVTTGFGFKGAVYFDVPLVFLPSAKKLILRSNGTFFHTTIDEWPAIDSGVPLPDLKTIIVDHGVCGKQFVCRLYEFLESQKKRGRWDTFEKFVVIREREDLEWNIEFLGDNALRFLHWTVYPPN